MGERAAWVSLRRVDGDHVTWIEQAEVRGSTVAIRLDAQIENGRIVALAYADGDAALPTPVDMTPSDATTVPAPVAPVVLAAVGAAGVLLVCRPGRGQSASRSRGALISQLQQLHANCDNNSVASTQRDAGRWQKDWLTITDQRAVPSSRPLGQSARQRHGSGRNSGYHQRHCSLTRALKQNRAPLLSHAVGARFGSQLVPVRCQVTQWLAQSS